MNFNDLVLTVEEDFRNEILAVFKIYSRVRVRVVLSRSRSFFRFDTSSSRTEHKGVVFAPCLG